MDHQLPKECCIHLVSLPLIDHKSKLRCGSYTAEWVARAIGVQTLMPSNRVIHGPVWFDIFRPVFPYDMKMIFKNHGIDTIEFRMDTLLDKERLQWIRKRIAIDQTPPVLLIREKTLHWIAIGGYDDTKEMFYIYDSLSGKDSFNKSVPIGNAQISYDALLRKWNGRWSFRYVALVVSHVEKEDSQKERSESIIESFVQGKLAQIIPKEPEIDEQKKPDVTL